jgi:hypothetical protein
MEIWIGNPEPGRLHKIGASGWGCLLMHRDVVSAVKPILKGEYEIIEDDMDIYPYDLSEVMKALAGLRELAETKPRRDVGYPALEHHLSVLEQEIRPLRADNEVVGSDIRFPFFARQAGYQLWGDPDVKCGHVVDYPLSPNDYLQESPESLQITFKDVRKQTRNQRRRLKAQKEALYT